MLLAPRRHDGRASQHRPFVVAGADYGEAGFLGAFPVGAEAVLRELPGALTPVAGADRLALHLAVRHEGHLEFEAGRRRGGERLTVEERRLDVARRKFCRRRGRCGRDVKDTHCDCGYDARESCAHDVPPKLMIRERHDMQFHRVFRQLIYLA